MPEIPYNLLTEMSRSDMDFKSAHFTGTSSYTVKNVRPETLILAAARTLSADESGATVVMNSATGFTVTLPTPVAGMRFRVMVGTTNTSGNHKIITNAGTVYLKGSLLTFVEDTTPGANPGPKEFVLNGSTHIAIVMNGTTTGGLVGTCIELVAVSTTIWLVSGLVKASGIIATPASNS